MAYKIFTDSASNIPSEILKQNDITVIPLSYFENGIETLANPYEAFDYKGFYNKMRENCEFKTSQVPPDRFIKSFERALIDGYDVLYIGLSKEVSGTFNSALIAADELNLKYPERKVKLINSRGADMGEGLIVLKACELKNNGVELNEAKTLLESYLLNVAQIFTVDDLKYLKRTGRISGFTAKLGSVLNIKPLLKGSAEGRIVSFSKVRGRRASINAIFEEFKRLCKSPEQSLVAISQADCPEDAETLKQLILSHCSPKQILIVGYEAVMGCHVGPDALALFFEGNEEARA